MSRIVTTHYRYQRPPRKSKPMALAGPAVVTMRARQPEAEPAAATAPPPTNDDGTPKRPAIVTIRRRGRFGNAPDLTPEEHRRRGDAADALFRTVLRRAIGKD